MPSRKKNNRPNPHRGMHPPSRPWLSGKRPWLAGLALFALLISPALRDPAKTIITGGATQGSQAALPTANKTDHEVRPFTWLVFGAQRLLSPGGQPAAWPGYPRTRTAPADAPGLIASGIATPLVALGQPVLAWNLAAILIPWLTLLSMAWLCRTVSGNAVAAGIAGLGYTLQPIILLEPTLTFLLLSPLLPAAILGLQGMLAGKGHWAFGWFACICLALVWAPLPIACAAGIAVGVLLLHARPHEQSLAGKILIPLIFFALLRGLLHPELRMPTALLSGAPGVNDLRSFFPGGIWGPGLVISGLAILALLDRWRGPRLGPMGDPRLLLLGIVAVLPVLIADRAAFGESQISLPGTWLETRYPVANSLRWCLRLLLPLSWCLLASFGGLAILERFEKPRARQIVALLLFGMLAAGNLLYPAPPLSLAPMQSRHVSFLSPPEEEARLLGQAQAGALLDLPSGGTDPAFHRLLASAWHRRATTQGSADGRDPSPLLTPFAARVDRPDGAEALAALGFGNILVHKHDLTPEAYENFLRRLARGAGAGGRLTTRFESPGHLLLGLQGNFPVSENHDVLESNQPSTSTLTLAAPEDLLVFELQVRGEVNFRNPEAEEEIPMRVEFFDARGRLVSEHVTGGVLPIVVAHGGLGHMALRLPVPAAPGRYTARLAPQSDPALTLAIQSLEVLPENDAER